MEIEIAVSETTAAVQVARLSGRLDTLTHETARSALVDALATAPAGLILDLGHVDFVSSAGLRTLLVLSKQASAEGKKVAMVAVKPSIYKIFKISALDKIFQLFDDEGEALRQLWP